MAKTNKAKLSKTIIRITKLSYSQSVMYSLHRFYTYNESTQYTHYIGSCWEWQRERRESSCQMGLKMAAVIQGTNQEAAISSAGPIRGAHLFSVTCIRSHTHSKGGDSWQYRVRDRQIKIYDPRVITPSCLDTLIWKPDVVTCVSSR